MDNVASTDWDLGLYGGTGNDRLGGGLGNDRIFGGAGADSVDGGSGSDRLNAGSGNDTLVYRLGVNLAAGTYDIYTGGSGRDTLVLDFTRGEWMAWQGPLADYLAHLALVTNPKTGEVSNGVESDFLLQFGGSMLLVQMIELLQVNVDGVALTPQDDPVTAVADSAATTGETAGVSVAILANDTVPDLVRDVVVSVGPTNGKATLSMPDADDPSTWTIGYVPDPDAFQYLAAGQSATDTFRYVVTDADGDTGSALVTVTIQGENDPVSITSGAAAAAVVEDAADTPDPDDATSRSGTIAFTDVDLADGHSASFAAAKANITALGSFALAPVSEADGAAGGSVGWQYTLDNAAAQSLAKGETALETFEVTIDDKNGSTATHAVAVTITGTNDPVSITSGPSAVTVVEDAADTSDPDDATSRSGTIAFTDVDLADGHSASFAAAQANKTALGTFALDPVSEAAGAAGGSVGWHYTLDNTAAQSLAKGQTAVETFDVTIDDGNGSTATHAVAVTITGTNDPTSISVLSGDRNAASRAETDAGLTADGTLTVRDPDLTDTVASTVTGVTVTGPRGGLSDEQVLAWLKLTPTSGLAADPADTGNLEWRFDSANEAFDFLGVGQTLTLSYAVTASDGHGSSDTASVAITITGSADGPSDILLSAALPGGNNIPNGDLGQFTAVGAAGAVKFSAALTEKNLAGAVQTDSTPDLVVDAGGLLTAATGPNGIEEGRLYELLVTAADAGGSVARLFRIATGSTKGEVISLDTAASDVAYLGGDVDTIHAGAGDDIVFGQNGNDRIHGEAGNDLLYGMNGADHFYFDTALDASTNVDKLADFNADNSAQHGDTIWLSPQIFTGLSSGSGTLAAQDFQQVSSVNGSLAGVTVGSAVNIVFDAATGTLFHDPDGGALDNAVPFAVLVVTGVLNQLDFQIG